MLDHVGLYVSSYPQAKDFYTPVLSTLGASLVMEVPPNEPVCAGYATGPGEPPFWVATGRPGEEHTLVPETVHVAFSAMSREQVDEFYAAAINAGGKCNGKPGVRAEYHPSYYAAFVLDEDGHNIEAVCHAPPA